MTISKSLPIKFSLTGDPTYNESEICGVYPDCFCEHVNYGEYITLQFNHSAALTLRAYDQDGNLLSSQAMTSLGSNYYQLKFKPNEFIANEIVKVIRFTVVNGSGTELAKSGCVIIGGCLTINSGEILINGDFNASLSPWTNESYGGDPWVWNSNTAKSTPYPVGSDLLKQSLSGIKPPGVYQYEINFKATLFLIGGPGTYDSGYILINLFSSGVFSEQFTLSNFLSNNVNDSGIGTFTATAPFDEIKIELSFSFGSPSGSYDFIIYDISITSPVGADFTRCFDLDCSVTITYTNTKNFDGFVYELTPQPINQIVIPAQFDVEDEPTEQSNIEISSGEIIMLRQKIVTKRLLKIGYMPNYMHQKLRRILMHDTVRIEGTDDDQDNSYFRMLDAYETTPVNRYGLKMAQVWLTLYNSIEENTL